MKEILQPISGHSILVLLLQLAGEIMERAGCTTAVVGEPALPQKGAA